MSVENTAGKSENFELVAAIQGALSAGLELETARCVACSKKSGSARFYGSMVTESRKISPPNLDLEDFPCPSSLLSVKGPAMSLDFLGHTTKSCKYFSRSFSYNHMYCIRPMFASNIHVHIV